MIGFILILVGRGGLFGEKCDTEVKIGERSSCERFEENIYYNVRVV